MEEVMRKLAAVFLCLASCAIVSASSAALSLEQQKRLDSICSSFCIPICDSSSISDCIKEYKTCIIAANLARFAEWLVVKGKTHDDCMIDLRRRYDYLTDQDTSRINLEKLPVAGDQNAPVIITIYVFDMCPLCTYLFVELHREVTRGTLKGKARLAAKLFDERTDSIAKARFSRFWDYIAALNGPVARNDRRMLVTVVDSTDKYPPAYKKLVNDLNLRIKPVVFREQSSKEASINPPIFVNNKRYRSYNNPQWVVDAALFEFEKNRELGGGKTVDLIKSGTSSEN
jgi:hypothetical protein